MKATKVGNLITVIVVLLALGFTFFFTWEASDQGTQPSTGPTASVAVPPDLPSRIAVDQQSDGLTKSMPEKRSAQSRSMLEWQRDLYDPQQ